MHSAIPRIPFTQEAYDNMQAELTGLIEEEKALIVRVQVAREMGDLSENGAYKYGRLELGNTRRRIRELRRLLKVGQVVQSSNSGKIEFGSAVTVIANGKESTFTIVSEFESDPMNGKISFKSPLGSAMTGKSAGEVFILHLNGKSTEYKILKIN